MTPDHFIRGGQTTQHWFRMGVQVIKAALGTAVTVYLATATFYALAEIEIKKIPSVYAYYMAEFYVENKGEPERQINFHHDDGTRAPRSALSIYTDRDLEDRRDRYMGRLQRAQWVAILPGLVSAFVAALVFVYVGRGLERDNHIRGTSLVTEKELRVWVKSKWKRYEKLFGKDRKKGPKYTVNGIQFPPNAIEAQTGIFGTVGTGKTNLLNELLTVVREANGKAIIYDRMGTFVRDFYDKDNDVIINPFDQRSRTWTPFCEAGSEDFFTQIAEVFIPDNPNSNDPFWTNAARIVFDYVARELWKANKLTNAELRNAILNIESDKLAELLLNTPGSHFFNSEIQKTSSSIRANMIAELRFLEFLRDDGGDPFSIREWVKDDTKKGFIFLTGDAEHAAATRNITSTLLEISANALMSCDQVDEPKIWFIIDEVPSLNKLPFLPPSLAQIRQFGGAIVLGYQVYAQLEDIYGEKGAQSIAGVLNNRFVFNTPDARTAEMFSKSLGSQDAEENHSNISVGAHETRDGVQFVRQRVERQIVTASEIQSLPQFVGYVRFAYDAPTARIEFKPFDKKPVADKFIPYHGRGFARGELLSPASSEISTDNTPSLEQAPDREDEFQRFRNRLVKGGLAIFMTENARTKALRYHFYQQRAGGVLPSEIAVPDLTKATNFLDAPSSQPTAAYDGEEIKSPPSPTPAPTAPDTQNEPSVFDAVLDLYREEAD